MAKKARNKKLYKRMVPKMIKFENEKLKQVLGMVPVPEDTRFSFRKHFQERDTKPDVQMTDLSDICTGKQAGSHFCHVSLISSFSKPMCGI